MSKKKRLLFFGIFVGVFLLSYSVGAIYKMSPDEAKNFLKDFQSETEGIDAVGIFTHNLTAALPMFVPAFGVGWGCYTGWSTGAAFNALVQANPMLSRIPPLAILLASPYGAMELVAYSIGMSRSLLLLFTIIKRKQLLQAVRPTAIEIGIVIGLLLVAALLEYFIVVQHGSI